MFIIYIMIYIYIISIYILYQYIYINIYNIYHDIIYISHIFTSPAVNISSAACLYFFASSGETSLWFSPLAATVVEDAPDEAALVLLMPGFIHCLLSAGTGISCK